MENTENIKQPSTTATAAARILETITNTLSDPEFLYRAAMAASLLASLTLLFTIIFLLRRLFAPKPARSDKIALDIESLPVPTLQPAVMQPVPKVTPPVYGEEIAEAITAHILNRPQPNRVS
jgi:hypothetical protein